MTRWNINLFSLLTCGCIALLFFRVIHSYPHTELEFPNSFEDFDSDEDEVEQPEIQTTVSIRENQSLISNKSHVNGHGNNSRSYATQDISILSYGTHKTEVQIDQRHNQMQSDDDKIVFPTEGTPPRCNKSNTVFCENVPNYPENMINNAIQQNSSLKYFETIDELFDIRPKVNPSETDERPLCESNSQIIYPQMAPSKHKGDLIVVNQPNFKQGVRIEKCVNENSECSIAGNNIPGGYKTKCVQKYIDRKLVAVTGINEVAQELFPIPSSCCCHAVFTVSGVERFGMGVKQTSQTTPAKSPKK